MRSPELPESWDLSTVGQEFSIQLGKMLDAARNVGVAKPYLGNSAVRWGRIDVSKAGTVPLTPADMKKYKLRNGDLLVCEGGDVGRSAIWYDQLDECYYQKALHRLRSKRGFEPRLLMYLLELWSEQGQLANYVTQTSIAHLPKDKLELLPLPRPPRKEQQGIVRVLTAADELIDCVRALIAKKHDVKQGAMQQLLTGRTRLPGFDGEWKLIVVDSLGQTYGGLTGKTKGDFEEGAARYVPFMDVMEHVALTGTDFPRVRVRDNESQNIVKVGDLLFNGSSETPEELALCAMVGSVPRDTYLNSFCFGFRLSDHGRTLAAPLFIAYLFRSDVGRDRMRTLAQGATRYNLAKAQFRRLEVPLPPLDEQHAIARVIEEMDAEIDALAARLRKTQEIRLGLMQGLLTGRTRLVGPDEFSVMTKPSPTVAA